jgi:dihydroorotate dehydrogenase (fumarate)
MKSTDLRVTIGPLGFEHPIVNAAGTCKRTEDVERLARSAVSAIIVGSITKEARAGNSGNVFAATNHATINSLGLPNGGLPYYETELPKMLKIAHEANKALIVSVAGFSPEQTAELVTFCCENMVDAIEVNLGCPNVWSEGKQKPITSYDRKSIGQVFKLVDSATLGNTDRSIIYGYKFSPLDPYSIWEIAEFVNAHPISFVTTTNTFPNGFGFQENGRMLIDSTEVPEGFGGVAGPGFKEIGLGQVKQWRNLLRPEIKVNGVGGVTNGKDVWEYQRAGADGLVQVGSHYFTSGERPLIFSDLVASYLDAREI